MLICDMIRCSITKSDQGTYAHIQLLRARAARICSKKTLYYTVVCWYNVGYGYRIHMANRNMSVQCRMGSNNSMGECDDARIVI